MLGLAGWRLWASVGAVAAIAALGVALWLQIEANGALKVKLSAANAVIQQREDDMKLSAQIVAQQAEALSKLETKVVTQIERIYAAPITRECAQSPSMRASTAGVRDIISPGPANAGRQPPAPVR